MDGLHKNSESDGSHTKGRSVSHDNRICRRIPKLRNIPAAVQEARVHDSPRLSKSHCEPAQRLRKPIALISARTRRKNDEN
jgi:hypothetical protein